VVIEKAANCAKTGGTLLVYGLANAQLNATLKSTKLIMNALKEEFNTVTKIAECCFEKLVFENRATKERTHWVSHFKNVFPGINEINASIKTIVHDVSEIKETANSMTLYERFQQAADENAEFFEFCERFFGENFERLRCTLYKTKTKRSHGRRHCSLDAFDW